MASSIKRDYSKGMSREDWEQNRKHQVDDDFPRGRGDPDFYPEPGQAAYEAEQALIAKRAASKAKPFIERPVEPTHWEGKLYPEWELKKMGEGDNFPDSPEKSGWDKQFEDQH